MDECCAPGPARILIETAVLRVDGETCERCEASVANARQAAAELAELLAPLGVVVELVEHAVPREALEVSNTVIVNGRPVEAWLGLARVSNECASCGELCGDEGIECGAVADRAQLFESYTAEQVRAAAIAALGGAVRGCCG